MLKTLQAGRAMAAIAVCAFHLSIMMGDARYLGHRVLDTYTWRGNLGVDFFFVLSGFIIMHAHYADINHPQQWVQYITKRIIRVYPIYWIYTVIYTLLILCGLGTAAKIPKDLIEWLSTLLLLRFENFQTPIVPAWTLFHEVGFYILFSSLIFSRKWGRIIFFVWFLIILYFFHYATPDTRTPFSTYFSAYNVDFLIGIGAYYLWKRNGGNQSHLLLPLGLLVLFCTLILEAGGFNAAFLPLLYGLAFGGILSGITIWESSYQEKLKMPTISLIGNASYTIYLTHESVMGVFLKVLIKVNKFFYLSPLVIYFLVLALTTLTGCIIFKAIEVPLLRYLRVKLLKSNT